MATNPQRTPPPSVKTDWEILVSCVMANLSQDIDLRHRTLHALIKVLPRDFPGQREVRLCAEALDQHVIRQRELALVVEKANSR